MDDDISHADIAADMDKFRSQLESKFRTKTRDQWATIFSGKILTGHHCLYGHLQAPMHA
jgi:hypothetical protein